MQHTVSVFSISHFLQITTSLQWGIAYWLDPIHFADNWFIVPTDTALVGGGGAALPLTTPLNPDLKSMQAQNEQPDNAWFNSSCNIVCQKFPGVGNFMDCLVPGVGEYL
jgi:hypothetical protein